MTAPATLAAPKAARRFRPSFFFWMTLAMAFFVLGGFGMSYIVPMGEGTFPPAPPIVHLHGLIFFSWMILLVTQSALVGAGNVRLHRSLGTWGIAHGSCRSATASTSTWACPTRTTCGPAIPRPSRGRTPPSP